MDRNSINKLMIVAHPDDETIFGGMHLLSGDWLVVCLTYNKDCDRGKEFFSAMEASANMGLMLGYPDLSEGVRYDWKKIKRHIYQDISKIISERNWKQIVTHNPDGEYGHIHHVLTSRITRKIVRERNIEDHLFYFSRYIAKEKIASSSLIPMEDTKLNLKMNLLRLYGSQPVSMDALCHIFPYEYFIPSFLWKKSISERCVLLKEKLLCKGIRRRLAFIIKKYLK